LLANVFFEETDFIDVIYNIQKIFSISQAKAYDYVFNFTKSYGYNLEGEYGYFDGVFIKIDEFSLLTKVEQVEMFGFNQRLMGRTISEIEFKITHEHSKDIIMDKRQRVPNCPT
jgi:hypothetical protein